MKLIILMFPIALIAGCVSASQTELYDSKYRQIEIADRAAPLFGFGSSEVFKALEPTFEKYGQPSLFVEGRMSGVNDPRVQKLYGIGKIEGKLRLPQPTFWQIEGQHLQADVLPIPTIHLIYSEVLINDGSVRKAIGSLDERGATFTVFEREVDGDIVVTVHPSHSLSASAIMEKIMFARN